MNSQLRPIEIAANVLIAVLTFLAAGARANWDDFIVQVDPRAPTTNDKLNVRAYRNFGDTGYVVLDQSISNDGNQIGVKVLIQDEHSRPGYAFADVVLPYGANFQNVGPLAAGNYQLNAQMFLTPWPQTTGGQLIASGSLEFSVADFVSPSRLAGDYNDDGVVDAIDYTVWRNHLGQSMTLPNDATPGTVTQADYDVWRANFRNQSGSGAGATVTVPEPAAMVLLLLAAAVAVLRDADRRVKT